jgi:HEAT repeat protein
MYSYYQATPLKAIVAVNLPKFEFRFEDPAINQSAADALGALKARPDIAVPALENALRDTNAPLRAIAANSLIWFENRAQPALPSLSNALVDPNPDVRQAATNAIQQISFSLRRTQKR